MGTELRTSNTANDEPVGPMGWNNGTSPSEPKMAVPVASCVVVTMRGLELGDDMAKMLVEGLEGVESGRIMTALETNFGCVGLLLGRLELSDRQRD